MLGKLILYDIRALGRSLLPVQLVVLLFGLATTVLFTFSMRYSFNNVLSSLPASRLAGIMQIGVVIGVIILFSLLCASAIMTLVLVVRHFYLNLMGDEGYLSFTLPVTVTQHVVAKTLSGLMWIILNALVILFLVLVFAVFGTASKGIVNSDFVTILNTFFADLFTYDAVFLIVEYPVKLLLDAINLLLLLYFALSAGAALAHRHKIAVAALIFIGICIVVSIVQSVAETVMVGMAGGYPLFNDLLYLVESSSSYLFYLQISMIVKGVISVLLSIAYYAFTHHLLSNRLNLE